MNPQTHKTLTNTILNATFRVKICGYKIKKINQRSQKAEKYRFGGIVYLDSLYVHTENHHTFYSLNNVTVINVQQYV